MSVLVKGMKMPKGCYECPLLDGEYGGCKSGASGEYDPYCNDCPLVDVPEPHGRLVEFIEVATQEEEDSGTELIEFGDVFLAYMTMREEKPVIEAEGE